MNNQEILFSRIVMGWESKSMPACDTFYPTPRPLQSASVVRHE